jgi:hypothetical protein
MTGNKTVRVKASAASALVCLAISSVVCAVPAQADPIDGDTQYCLSDRPCIVDMHDLVEDGIYVGWDPAGLIQRV